MKLSAVSLVAIALLTGVASADEAASVICADGAKHAMRLTEVEPGTLGSREAQRIDIGPSAQAWLKLPSGARLAEHQPIPVADLNAKSIEVQVEYANRRREDVRATLQKSAGDGLTKVNIIRTRISSYSYALPTGCRVMSPAEANDYAQALLNNAGCLLPADVHQKLARIPGASGSMTRDCGWAPDIEAALHTLKKSAERGSMHAGWILSQFYLGNLGKEYVDHHRAYGSLAQTASVGHASADLMTAVMRWRGDGVAPDAAAAFAGLLPHARMGSREAQGIIGVMYLTGNGAPTNPVHAWAWCSLASKGARLLHSDAAACRQEAESQLSYDQLLDARDLAVQIHNGHW